MTSCQEMMMMMMGPACWLVSEKVSGLAGVHGAHHWVVLDDGRPGQPRLGDIQRLLRVGRRGQVVSKEVGVASQAVGGHRLFWE